MEIVYLIMFIVFCFVQSMFIIGVKDCFGKDMIFENLGKWLKEKLGEKLTKPLFGCVKCMSSLWGAVTYFPTVLCYYGYESWQIPVFIADAFVLVFMTYYLYKRQ